MYRKWIATFGGFGLLPAMPGTFASLATAALFFGIHAVAGAQVRLYAALIAAAAVIAAYFVYDWSCEYFRNDDPRQFVLDEVAGQMLTLIFVPLDAHLLSYVAMGFLLFRAFDVAKPFVVGMIDRLHGFAGFILDDIAAGALAAVVFWILIFLLRFALGIPV